MGLQSKNNELISQLETGRSVTFRCSHNTWVQYQQNNLRNREASLNLPSRLIKTHKARHNHYRFQDVTADITVTSTLKAIMTFEMRLYVQVMSWIQTNTDITLQ